LLGSLGLLLVWWLATTPGRGGTRVVLAAEGITVLLIVIVIVIVFAKLAGHAGPGKLGVDWSVFSVPHGVALSAVFLGIVFGFLSFAGFEAASTLGEETTNPRRDIPRAILGVAIFGGIYFVIVTAVEAMGFGTSTKGVGAFVASQSLIGDLGRMYVSSWIGNIITIGAMVSAFSCALACCVGASRLVFALSRDGLLHDRLARVAPGRRTPTLSTAAVVLAAYVIIAFTWFVLRGDPFTLFGVAATIGTLILLVVYIMATVGMMKLVFFSGGGGSGDGGGRPVRPWEIVIPVLGIVILGYTLFRNVWPLPTGVAWWGPGVAIAWLVIGVVWAFARPGAAMRAGAALMQAEGLAGAPATQDASAG
jgi:amino acid transporter